MQSSRAAGVLFFSTLFEGRGGGARGGRGSNLAVFNVLLAGVERKNFLEIPEGVPTLGGISRIS